MARTPAALPPEVASKQHDSVTQGTSPLPRMPPAAGQGGKVSDGCGSMHLHVHKNYLVTGKIGALGSASDETRTRPERQRPSCREIVLSAHLPGVAHRALPLTI